MDLEREETGRKREKKKCRRKGVDPFPPGLFLAVCPLPPGLD